MSLTKDIYEAFKAVMVMESRVSHLAESVNVVSEKVENNFELLSAKLEGHAERLARLEGKFELLERSFAARRRPKLTE